MIRIRNTYRLFSLGVKMKIEKKTIAAAIGILLTIAVAVRLLTRTMAPENTDYIVNQSQNISFDDVRVYLRNMEFDDASVKQYFSNDVVNMYTVKFFKSLQMRFKDLGYEEHLKTIYDYLHSTMSKTDADSLYSLYTKYVEYEKELSAITTSWGIPDNPDKALSFIRKMRDFQYAKFGKEIADELFGAELKAMEYPVRRGAIVNEESMYGAEKERRLRKLNRDMWGNESGVVENNTKPYDKYYEKLAIYEKDMSEMTPDEKVRKIQGLREEIFPPDVVARLDNVDCYFEREKELESLYRAREKEISTDKNLTREQKSAKIEALQNEMMGAEGAERYRSRERLRNSANND